MKPSILRTPLKGYILDQGRPTHKALILNLYEQGYERVKGLYKKQLTNTEIQKVTGLSLKVVNAYLSIAKQFHPERANTDGHLAMAP